MLARMLLPTKVLTLDYVSRTTTQTNATTYTFNNVNIGPAAVGRYVVAGILGWSGGAGSRTVSSLTIAGISTTRYGNQSALYPSALCGATVDTGTTATIVVTMSNSMTDMNVYVFTIYNLQSTTPVGVATAGVGNTARTVNLTTTSGGVMIAECYAYSSSGTPPFAAWTGVTERDETRGVLGANAMTSAATGYATDASTTITCAPDGGSSFTGAQMVAACWK